MSKSPSQNSSAFEDALASVDNDHPPTPPAPVAEAPESLGERQDAALEEKCYRLRFHVKSGPNDDDNVILAVNGEVLILQRNKEVVLPERFVEVARNALEPQFRQLPNQERKFIGEVQTYPFDILGEATMAEFYEMKAKGAKAKEQTLQQVEE